MLKYTSLPAWNIADPFSLSVCSTIEYINAKLYIIGENDIGAIKIRNKLYFPSISIAILDLFQ